MIKENSTAGPACWAAAVPAITKMPAPMISPMPNMVRCTGPSARCSCGSASPSAIPSSATVMPSLCRGFGDGPSRRPGMLGAIGEIDAKTDDRPDDQPQPGVHREKHHHEEAHTNASWRHEPDEGRTEWAHSIG